MVRATFRDMADARRLGDWRIQRAVTDGSPTTTRACGILCEHRDGRSLILELDSNNAAVLEISFNALTLEQLERMVALGNGAATGRFIVNVATPARS